MSIEKRNICRVDNGADVWSKDRYTFLWPYHTHTDDGHFDYSQIKVGDLLLYSETYYIVVGVKTHYTPPTFYCRAYLRK